MIDVTRKDLTPEERAQGEAELREIEDRYNASVNAWVDSHADPEVRRQLREKALWL